MKNLHNKLVEKGGSYAKWHNQPAHKAVHFWAVAVVGVLFSAAILVGIDQGLALSYQETGLIGNFSSNSIPGKSAEHLPELSTKLLQAVKAYQKSSESEKPAALNNLIVAAQARREVMLSNAGLIPERFLLSALPSSLKAKLPGEIAPIIEQEAEISGEVTVFHVDYPDETKNHFLYELEEKNTGKKYNLSFAKGEPDFETGWFVRVKGVALDNQLVMAQAGDYVNTTLQASITAGPTGQQNTLVMLVNFTNSSSQPWTQTQVSESLFSGTNSTNKYYQENPFNKTYFSGAVTSWITIPYDNTNCSSMYSTWAVAADSAATAQGFVLSNYNRKLYVMAGAASCGWAGFSSIGGNPSRSWTNNYNNVSLYDHELGRGIGMRHASSYSCGAKAIDNAANCSLSEYGDAYDTMGGWVTYHVNGAHKVQQTWIPNTNVQTIASGNGTYTIYPLEISSTNIQVLKIPKANTNEYYYVDYRQPVGFDASLPAAAVAGPSIHVWGGMNTKRLDATPGDGNFNNSFLVDGRSFVDEINGVTITQLSHSSTSAEVQVVFGTGVCSKAKPSLSVSPLSQTAAAGQPLSYSVMVINNDSPACNSTTFAVSALNLPLGFTFSSSSITLAPSGRGSVSLTVTSPIAQLDGSFVFSPSATDTTDSTHSNTSNATYIVFTDLGLPTVAVTSPVNGAKVNGNINISASAQDNVGVVKLEFYIDGVLKATDTSSPYSYRWNVNKQVASGVHTITAKAYDSAGNSAVSTITVFK